MKKSVFKIFVLIVFLFSFQLNAQNIIGQDVKNPNPIIKETQMSLFLSQKFSFLSLENVNTEKGVFIKFDMGENFGTTQKIGMPELPIFSQLIELPYGADFEIEYSNVITETYSLDNYGNYKIIPFQKSMSKSETENPFIINENAYLKDEFFGNDLVVIEKLGYMSGVRLARLAISPIKYNPLTNKIVFVKSFDVNIKFKNTDFEATQNAKLKHNNQQSAFVGQKVINAKNQSATLSSSPINRPLKMIILSDPMFTDVLQPFIRWKKEKGIEIIELYKGQPNVGTTNQDMKNCLQSLWNNASPNSPSADYLLICGDIQQIPAFSAVTDPNNPAPTDLYYAEYTGDFLPDLFYGRFSAQTVAQMEAIINKTITYEQNLMQDNNYLKKTLLVAGRETSAPAPTCGNGQVNYGKLYLMNNPNIDTLIYYNPSSSNYATQIRDSISNYGFSFINYTAHCDETGWSSPSLTSTQVKNMNNLGKYAFYINNCCLSSRFNESECFAEAILRASNKGGIGVIGGSNYTYWYEDFYWSVGSKSINVNPNYDSNNLGAYDRLFHKNNESFEQWYTTAGQIVQAGNLSVQKYGSNLSNYYWEIYHLLGDPSLSPYVGLPFTISSNLPDSIAIGSSNLPIQTSPFAFVGVSQNGQLIGASQADSTGGVNVIFTNIINSMDKLKVVITNQFSYPIIDSINVLIPNYPFVNINSLKYYNNQQQEVEELKNNEEYTIGFNIVNIGTVSIDSIRLNIINTPNLFLLDSNQYIGLLAASSNLNISNAFKIKILNGTIDKTQIQYSINIVGQNNYLENKTFSFEAFCPKLEIENLRIAKDTINELLVGEKLIVNFDIKNIGRNNTELGNVYLSSLSSNLTFQSDSNQILNILSTNSSTPYSFNLILDDDITEDFLKFKISAVANQYFNARIYDSIFLSGNVETFETGDITFFPWINDVSKPWTIESNLSKVYQGQYSLRSGDITNTQSTKLMINIKSIMNDSMSFYLKTSTEANYDKFSFYIDDVLQLEISGEKDWQRHSFAVMAGEHNYRWEYQKDYSESNGSDAVWVDNICFPPDAIVYSNNAIEKESDNIYIYPNPVRDIINIYNLKNSSEITIYDAIGRIKYFSSNTIVSKINVTDFENGIYYLTIKTENSTINKKIIIAR